ncbi:DUF7426 family protein [Prescottella equi]|uniref:DUF7426 domain-containing protein n=1 Tax=Rhodococcus phage REQ3 TaxID=1109714 RepID=G9FH94_9CAUD|nr:hypothetical protein [Prescottella equi]YP_005087239.1 tail assembly chaperone [Rhodococcus phage REQ3]AEV51983.1 hypothetical protein [Rhodococcus phage REQ3]ERN43242.1 hypothetical protein H849_24274 [Prescottella equi NBRC 101255 = C 7]ORL29074.1 hypothetical protein A6I89_01965 [Prescottella equi]QPQ77260.1 hypothetical protein I6H09_24420 [Prescottella equi]SUE04889.1 Uncharacterised protein [Prescottella equi]
MPYNDLREFFDPDLHLPINGKTYTIHTPNAADGLRLRAIFADDEQTLTNTDELAEIAKLFGADIDDDGNPTGGVWQQMNDDGISWGEIIHAGRTALMHYGISADFGAIYWRTGMDGVLGNPLPPNPNGETGENPSQSASAPESAEEPSPADPAPTAPTTPAAAHTSKRTASATGSTPNRSKRPRKAS